MTAITGTINPTNVPRTLIFYWGAASSSFHCVCVCVLAHCIENSNTKCVKWNEIQSQFDMRCQTLRINVTVSSAHSSCGPYMHLQRVLPMLCFTFGKVTHKWHLITYANCVLWWYIMNETRIWIVSTFGRKMFLKVQQIYLQHNMKTTMIFPFDSWLEIVKCN